MVGIAKLHNVCGEDSFLLFTVAKSVRGLPESEARYQSIAHISRALDYLIEACNQPGARLRITDYHGS